MSSTEVSLFLVDVRARAAHISEFKTCRSRKWPSQLSVQGEGEGCKERQTERRSVEEQPVMGIIWTNPAVTCKSTDLHVFELALTSEVTSVGRVTLSHVSYIHACAHTVHSHNLRSVHVTMSPPFSLILPFCPVLKCY